MDDSCPDSTIATSDVTAEGTMGTNNVTVESAMVSADVSEVGEKGDSHVVPEADAKLSLRMSLVTPVNDGSEESLPFSLESKSMKPPTIQDLLDLSHNSKPLCGIPRDSLLVSVIFLIFLFGQCHLNLFLCAIL